MGPRVVDFSTHLSGPLASHYLVELGANVIKVEHYRVGDGNRSVGPFIHGVGMIHVNCGPGARSLAADPRSPDWADVVRAAAAWADVVIVGARPVDAAARGLDFASIRRHNGEVVYCSGRGYGEGGPWAERPAHGLQMDAYAGHVPVQWVDGQPQPQPGFRTAGTTAAAMFAAMGIFAALYRREREGGPFFVDVSAWASAMAWQWRDVTTTANLGHAWTDYDQAGSRYAMYATADRRALLLCPLEQKFWQRLCDLLQLAERREVGDWSGGMEWGAGPEFAGERRLLEQRIATRTLREWIEMLEPTGIPFAPILELAEVIDSPHAAINGVVGYTTVDGKEAKFTRLPVHVGPSAGDVVEPLRLPAPPAIGEHTDQLLQELGLDHLRKSASDRAEATRNGGGVRTTQTSVR